MDSQIETFSDINFSAAASASRFFAEHTDAEVQRKLNELGQLQVYFSLDRFSKMYMIFIIESDENRSCIERNSCS